MRIAEVPVVANPFPVPPPHAGYRINTSRSRHRNWTAMAEVFASGVRPDDFKEAYSLCAPICGEYEGEAKAIWDFLRAHPEITEIAEIGRNLGGGIFILACACRGLKRFASFDLYRWCLTDPMIAAWMKHHNIQYEEHIVDSMQYKPVDTDKFDFIYIDGGHAYDPCHADVENWAGRTKWIGFHDYADLRRNKHRKLCRGVVKAVDEGIQKYGWEIAWPRDNSEVIFDARGGKVA